MEDNRETSEPGSTEGTGESALELCSSLGSKFTLLCKHLIMNHSDNAIVVRTYAGIFHANRGDSPAPQLTGMTSSVTACNYPFRGGLFTLSIRLSNKGLLAECLIKFLTLSQPHTVQFLL